MARRYNFGRGRETRHFQKQDISKNTSRMTWQNQSVGNTTHTIVTRAGTATRTRAWPWRCALALPQCPCHHPPSKRILYGPSSLYHLLSIQSSKWVHPKHSSVFPFLAAEETRKEVAILNSTVWNEIHLPPRLFFLFYVLAVPGLSCSLRDLCCGVQHLLVALCGLLVAACGF